MRWVYLVGALLFLAGCSATAPSSRTVDKPALPLSPAPAKEQSKLAQLPVTELVQKGNALRAEGNNQLAWIHYSLALGKDPASVDALVGMGHLCTEKDQALEYYQKALTADPHHRIARVESAKIHRQRNDLDRAIDLFQQGMDDSPEDVEIITELAITLDAAGEEERAEALYRQAQTLEPRRPSVLNNLGVNYIFQQRYAEAITLLGQAHELAPGDKTFLNNLGIAYLMHGDEAHALQTFEKSLGKAAALNNVGYLYMLAGQEDKARKFFQRAIQANPSYYQKAQANLDLIQQPLSPAEQ